MRTHQFVRVRRNGVNELKSLLDLGIAPTQQIGLHRLEVMSVHGALWLQSHFPSSEWDVLMNGQACFGMDCLTQLLEDAESAGLLVQLPIPAQS